MRIELLLGSVLALSWGNARSEIIAAWDFDDPLAAAVPAKVMWFSSDGWGEAQPANGSDFILDEGADGSDGSWSLGSFPPLNKGNKTTGAGFSASTVGFRNIRVSWKEAHSPSSSRYLRFQYTADGITYQDGPSIETFEANRFAEQAVDLAGVGRVENNPLFAVRLVTEFSRSAAHYLAVGPAPYHASGAIRLDDFIIDGEPLDPTLPPLTVPVLFHQYALENTPTTPLPLGPYDAATIFEARATDELLLPSTRVSFSYAPPGWTLTLHPQEDRSGTTEVALLVRDARGCRVRTSFPLSVTATNRPPLFASLPAQIVHRGETLGPIALPVSDPEGKPVRLEAGSSDPSLVPRHHLRFELHEKLHFLTITPGLGQIGTCIITVKANDSRHTVYRQFPLTVVPPGPVLLFDTFGYGSGATTSQSLETWSATGSGGVIAHGQVVMDGEGTLERACLPAAESSLPDQWFFTSFRLTCVTRPLHGQRVLLFEPAGERHCLSLMTSGAIAGSYRVALGNRLTGATAVMTADLRVGKPYRFLAAYHPRSALAQLWLDPSVSSGETGFLVMTNEPDTGPIRGVTLCGTMGGSAVKVDDLMVTLSRESALELPPVNLSVVNIGNNVEVSWPEMPETFVLEYDEGNGWKTHDGFPPLSEGRRIVRFFDSVSNRFFRLKRL